MSVVEYAVADCVARITLNRPERCNGITRPLIAELDLSVMAANHDPDAVWDPTVGHAMMSRNVRGFKAAVRTRDEPFAAGS